MNITYDLADTNNSTVELDISDDGGATWNVTDNSITGDVGIISRLVAKLLFGMREVTSITKIKQI